jgi:hypothetical protein
MIVKLSPKGLNPRKRVMGDVSIVALIVYFLIDGNQRTYVIINLGLYIRLRQQHCRSRRSLLLELLHAPAAHYTGAS